MKQQAPHLAVDTNILFAIADQQSSVITLVKMAKAGKGLLFVPPESLAELSYAYSKGDAAAGKAIRAIRKIHGLGPLILSSTQQAIANSVASRFLSERLLPVEEKRDAMALAQSVAGGMSAFVTFDHHFLSIDRRGLSALLLAEHLTPIAIVSPIDLIKAARRAEGL